VAGREGGERLMALKKKKGFTATGPSGKGRTPPEFLSCALYTFLDKDTSCRRTSREVPREAPFTFEGKPGCPTRGGEKRLRKGASEQRHSGRGKGVVDGGKGCTMKRGDHYIQGGSVRGALG